MKFVNSRIIQLMILSGTMLLAGCTIFTDLPAGTSKDVTGSPIVEQQSVSAPDFVDVTPPPIDYHVDPGDVLFVVVQAQPDLGSSALSAANGVQGNRIKTMVEYHQFLLKRNLTTCPETVDHYSLTQSPQRTSGG